MPADPPKRAMTPPLDGLAAEALCPCEHHKYERSASMLWDFCDCGAVRATNISKPGRGPDPWHVCHLCSVEPNVAQGKGAADGA